MQAKDMCRLSIQRGVCDRDKCRFKHTRCSKVTPGKKPNDKAPKVAGKGDTNLVSTNGSQAQSQNQIPVRSMGPVGMNNSGDPFLCLQSLVNLMMSKLTRMEQELNQIRNPPSYAQKVIAQSAVGGQFASVH